MWLEMRCMQPVPGDEGNADQGHGDSGLSEACLAAGSVSPIVADNSKQ